MKKLNVNVKKIKKNQRKRGLIVKKAAEFKQIFHG